MQGKGALTIWILTGVLGFLLASCRGWEMVWSGQPIKWWFDGLSRAITLIAQAIGDERENLKDMFEYVLDSFIAE